MIPLPGTSYSTPPGTSYRPPVGPGVNTCESINLNYLVITEVINLMMTKIKDNPCRSAPGLHQRPKQGSIRVPPGTSSRPPTGSGVNKSESITTSLI